MTAAEIWTSVTDTERKHYMEAVHRYRDRIHRNSPAAMFSAFENADGAVRATARLRVLKTIMDWADYLLGGHDVDLKDVIEKLDAEAALALRGTLESRSTSTMTNLTARELAAAWHYYWINLEPWTNSLRKRFIAYCEEECYDD